MRYVISRYPIKLIRYLIAVQVILKIKKIFIKWFNFSITNFMLEKFYGSTGILFKLKSLITGRSKFKLGILLVGFSSYDRSLLQLMNNISIISTPIYIYKTINNIFIYVQILRLFVQPHRLYTWWVCYNQSNENIFVDTPKVFPVVQTK